MVRSRTRDSGATAAEYAIMAGFIALVIIAAVTLLGTQVTSLFENAATLI